MDRIRGFLKRPRRPDANIARLRRRRQAAAYIHRNLTKLTSVESLLFALSLNLRRTALFVIGYAWMLLIPLPMLSQGTYIDENALQPAQVRVHIACLLHGLMEPQVNTYWNWGDVHTADLQLYQLDGIQERNLTSEQYVVLLFGHSTALTQVIDRRAEFFRTEFSKLGLAASIQNYTFSTSKGVSFFFV